jgi:Uma2 family endonuclease
VWYVADVSARTRWTIDDLDELPDDETTHYEIIDGELFVAKSPRKEHQMTCGRFYQSLITWNEAADLGEVILGPGLIFSTVDSVEPDLVWISHAQLAAVEGADGHLHGAPELVIEVLSPGTTNEQRDREKKLGLYARYGVQEYWIPDWRTQTIEVYRQHEGQLRLVATLGPADTLTSALLPDFAVGVAWLFARL